MCRDRSKDDKDIPRTGATNVTFYPIYQQVMSRLSSEFVTCMKEEKDTSLYVQFITKVIQQVGALDTSVRDVSAQEVLQTIKDRNCKYKQEWMKMSLMMMTTMYGANRHHQNI